MARSGLPSPSRSPSATLREPAPAGKLTVGAKLMLPHGTSDAVDDQPASAPPAAWPTSDAEPVRACSAGPAGGAASSGGVAPGSTAAATTDRHATRARLDCHLAKSRLTARMVCLRSSVLPVGPKR